jgi:CHRD domain
MRRARFYVLITAVMALVLGGASLAVAGGGGGGGKKNVKSDRLSGYQEVPPISTTGRGSFKAQIDTSGQRITFELRYEGLSGNAAQAHIHFGQRDVNGGISAFLCGGSTKPACPAGTSATVTGTIVPADVLNTVLGATAQGIGAGEFAELVAAIRAGRGYVNVHTASFPGGEIRAQLNNRNRK